MSEETTAEERAFREWLYKHLELKYPEEHHASREAAVEKILGGEDWIFTVDEVRLAFRADVARLETELVEAQELLGRVAESGTTACCGALMPGDTCIHGAAEEFVARAAIAALEPPYGP